MATPLPPFETISAYPVCETAFWVAFIIFLRGLMRLIIISETRELILRVVEMSQIFCLIIDIAKLPISTLGRAVSRAKNEKMCNLTVLTVVD